MFVFIFPKEAKKNKKKKQQKNEIPPAVLKPVSSLNSAGKRTVCTFNYAHFLLLFLYLSSIY